MMQLANVRGRLTPRLGKPPRFLQPGEVLSTYEGIGTLHNRLVAVSTQS